MSLGSFHVGHMEDSVHFVSHVHNIWFVGREQVIVVMGYMWTALLGDPAVFDSGVSGFPFSMCVCVVILKYFCTGTMSSNSYSPCLELRLKLLEEGE